MHFFIQSRIVILLSLLSAITAFSQSTQKTTTSSGGDWPQYLYGPDHTGYNVAEQHLTPANVPSLTLRWSVIVDQARLSTPITANETVYVTSYDGKLAAFNAKTGALQWRTNFGQYPRVPAAANGVVYVASGGWLGAFQGTTGVLIWTTPSLLSEISPPVVANNVVYITTTNSDNTAFALQAFDGVGGRLLWTTRNDRCQGLSTPTLAAGIIYVGCQHGNLTAYRETTGALLWNRSISTTWGVAIPSVADNMIYIESTDVFGAGCLANASFLWRTHDGSDHFGSAAVANGILYVGKNSWHEFYALQAKTGKPLWTFRTAYWTEYFFAPAVANGVVYFAGEYVYALDATTGTLLWNYITDTDFTSVPIVSDGMLYVMGHPRDRLDQGILYAFGLPDQ